jgi:DNA-binding CsgD family transcriptional regulator
MNLAGRERAAFAVAGGAPGFSPRETDCLTLLVRGLTDGEIANGLAITHATVRFHLDGARRKAGARSRTHLAALAVAMGVARP